MTTTDSIILSIIIPTKNRPQLLKNALASVAVQNFPAFEVCVVDNNTDDQVSRQAKTTVTEFEASYPHISWIYIHSPTQFASGARNDGMIATNGKYIIFLDDDDELLDNSIKIRVNEMEADPQLSLLYCAGYSKIYPYPFKMYRYYHYSKQLHKERLMMMSCSSIMISREIFEKNNLYFDRHQNRMEDYDLCKRIIELGLKVKSIPDALVLINLHPETRMSSPRLVTYEFKDLLIKKWGPAEADVVYDYAEGVYIWRKCFGIGHEKFSEITASLEKDFNRSPSLSFRLKHMLVSFSPRLFLGFYHLAVSISQHRKNKLAVQAGRSL